MLSMQGSLAFQVQQLERINKELTEENRELRRRENREIPDVCREETEKLQARVTYLEKLLHLCAARAGNPDPVEGCRHVILTAEQGIGK